MIIARSHLADLPHKIDYSDYRIQLDGYGQRKHPTRYLVQIPGSKRWRRVYCCSVGNAGTCYVAVKGGWHVIE